MFTDVNEYADALRSAPTARYLATLERFRLSEIDGAAELSLLARGLPDRRLARRIGIQAADEARHGEMIARILARFEENGPLNLTADPLPSLGMTLLAEARSRFRPILVRVWEGQCISEEDFYTILHYLYRAEERGVIAFQAHAMASQDTQIARWFEEIVEDEQRHLLSVGQLLKGWEREAIPDIKGL